MLGIPRDARGLVIFAHGSGSSRLSPCNRAVAAQLRARGFGTLLFDLLTGAEAADRARVFGIELLAQRVAGAVDWARRGEDTKELPIGLFGASTGAAAALVVAADPRAGIAAVVSRGGRPDLAGSRLSAVRSPTLLIVGGAGTEVLDLNRNAFVQLNCHKGLQVVPGATHLFEEAGALEQVVDLAAVWLSAAFAASVASKDRSVMLTG